MLLLKCWTQYASKFRKLSSGHRTGKGQFSFQSQRKAVPKNVQTITQLHSSHMLQSNAQNSLIEASTVHELKLQMFELDLEKAEESEIKLPTSIRSLKKQKSSRKKHLLLLYWLCQSLQLCGSQLWKIPKEMGIPEHLTCFLRNLYAAQEATVRTRHGTINWFQIGKGVRQGCILSPCLFNLCRVQFSSVTQSSPTLCDHMNHSMPGLPVHHQLPEFT